MNQVLNTNKSFEEQVLTGLSDLKKNQEDLRKEVDAMKQEEEDKKPKEEDEKKKQEMEKPEEDKSPKKPEDDKNKEDTSDNEGQVAKPKESIPEGAKVKVPDNPGEGQNTVGEQGGSTVKMTEDKVKEIIKSVISEKEDTNVIKTPRPTSEPINKSVETMSPALGLINKVKKMEIKNPAELNREIKKMERGN